MAEPIVIANRWLRATLQAAGAVSAIVSTRVYDNDIPPGVAYPVVLYEWLPPGRPAITHDGIRVMTTLTYRVRGIVTDESAAGTDSALASAIFAAIHRRGGVVTGGRVWSCQWVDDYQLYQTLPERRYRHLGGEYELVVQEA